MLTTTRAPAADKGYALFSRNALLFALFAVVIPNVLFLLVAPFYIASRLISPLLFLAAGIAGLFLPARLTFILFLLAALIDLTLMVMMAFHLPFDVALDSLKYSASINPAKSALYVCIVLVVTATSALSAWLISRNRAALRQASLVPALLLAAALSGADLAWTQPYFNKPDVPFQSARKMSGLSADAIIGEHANLLIVVVEGMGAYADPEARQLLTSVLTKNLPEGRFSVEDGQTYYSGSTTGAASRELCDRWGDYIDYLTGAPTDNCLPNQLGAAGYDTIAFHGFTMDMFQRDKWYPRIGFQKMEFMDQLEVEQPEHFVQRCGSVFNGLCDADVGKAVHARLKTEPDTPKFIYWLTLNSHIPYVDSPEDTMGCRSDTPKIRNKTVCELTNLWAIVFEEVNEIASDPDLANTDILIVGDHHTPLWERAAKDDFVLGKVDWILLRHND
ncbi:MAG: sulfatase-like hydrolase/transferase [Hyphomonas oceanitis]|uniref:sulfatase-like hydrolase/transferase n=1 Tax=Hyphomonas oceanitis TaxID=81033 RepID=UPI0030019B11